MNKVIFLAPQPVWQNFTPLLVEWTNIENNACGIINLEKNNYWNVPFFGKPRPLLFLDFLLFLLKGSLAEVKPLPGVLSSSSPLPLLRREFTVCFEGLLAFRIILSLFTGAFSAESLLNKSLPLTIGLPSWSVSTDSPFRFALIFQLTANLQIISKDERAAKYIKIVKW